MNSTYSDLVNGEIQIIQNVMISRYFTAAALVLVMYDATITMDDEVGVFSAHTPELRSFPEGPPSLAKAFRGSDVTLLHQPVLDDCKLDSCQLPWVTNAQHMHLRR